MRRHHALLGLAMAFVAGGVACVDLFHSTDFETLCTASPADPRCATDAGVVPDVVSEPGVDAPRPRPDFCSWTAARVETEAKRACAWLGACEGPLNESSFGKCVVRAQLAFDCDANPTLRPGGATDDFWSCLATVKTTCAEVDRCVFPTGVVDQCGTIGSGSFTSCGNGNGAVNLKCSAPGGNRASGVEPCAMLGKTCSKLDESTAACTGTLGGKSAGAVVCVENACRGTVARNCRGGGSATLDDGFDCASQSATCASIAGVPACSSVKGPACTAAAAPSCDGARVTTCVSGHELTVDCAKIGLDCDVTKLAGPDLYDITAACTLNAPTCTTEDSCNGATLTSCARGKSYDVDCVSVGLKACGTITANGKAACATP